MRGGSISRAMQGHPDERDLPPQPAAINDSSRAPRIRREGAFRKREHGCARHHAGTDKINSLSTFSGQFERTLSVVRSIKMTRKERQEIERQLAQAHRL